MYGSVGKGKGREVYISMIDYSSVGNLSNNSVVYESEVWWCYGSISDEEIVVQNFMVFAMEFGPSSLFTQISLFLLSQTLSCICRSLLVYLWLSTLISAVKT